MMDKGFEQIDQMLRGQAKGQESVDDDWNLDRCKHIAESYALMENAVIAMGDTANNRSFCYFGGLADILDIPQEQRQPVIPSLYESFLFDRVNPEDLQQRHIHEIAFLHLTKGMTPEERRRYCVIDCMRARDGKGVYHNIQHRLRYLTGNDAGGILIAMCIYTILRSDVEVDYESAKIVNTQTGECHYLTNNDYRDVLSEREQEVLRLISKGLLSKEIADRLSISINTVNRHRQNILAKLQVDNAIEACSIARKMGVKNI